MELKRTPPEAVFKDSNATLEQVLNIYGAIAGEPIDLTPEEKELFNKYGADYLKEYYERFKEYAQRKDLQRREGKKK